MRAIVTCAALVLTGCGFLIHTQKVQHAVPVEVAGGQVTAYKVLSNVGDEMAMKAGIRVVSPSIDELRTWQTVVELTSYSPDRACFRLTDYQFVADDYADGGGASSNPSDFTTAQLALDTASGQHYVATPTAALAHMTFRYEGYITEVGVPPRWVPGVSHYLRSVVDACFDTTKPLAEEKGARWTIKNKAEHWELAFDLAIGGAAGTAARSVAAARPVQPAPAPAPATAPAPAPAPTTFVGRWRGEASMVMSIGEKKETGRSDLTIAVTEATGSEIAVRFEDGSFDCAIRARVSGRLANVVGGQVCKLEQGKSSYKFRTEKTQLQLTATGIQLVIELDASRKIKGKTEKGTVSIVGDLAPL
jgi:hypothetical protein